MTPVQAALSALVSVSDYARWAEREAAALDFPLAQAREGKAIPPTAVIAIIEAQQQQFRRSGALNIMLLEMFVQIVRGIPQAAPPRPWWRRWWFR